MFFLLYYIFKDTLFFDKPG